MTSCPSIEELKNFSGLVVEYPLNLDINTKAPLSWIVAQTQLNQKKQTLSTFVQSPVKPNQGEYPKDAAMQMIDSLEPLNSSPVCDNQMSKHASLCACPYWNPNDGSLATFLVTEYKSNQVPSLATQLKMSSKMMSLFTVAKP